MATLDVAEARSFAPEERRMQRGDMMKIIRLKKGLNQREFATFVGASLRTYSSFERGSADVPMKTMDQWLEKCGMGILSISI